jgi:hypothetical protein
LYESCSPLFQLFQKEPFHPPSEPRTRSQPLLLNSAPGKANTSELQNQTPEQFLKEQEPAKESQKLGVVGNGVEIKPSTIPNAGNGLFASRPFRKNELITAYEGEKIDRKTADEMRAKGQATHVRSVAGFHELISGYTKPEQAVGKGGGSFINDVFGSNLEVNAEYAIRRDPKTGLDAVYIKALRDLQPGEEILASYGKDYWKQHAQAPETREERMARYERLLKLQAQQLRPKSLQKKNVDFDIEEEIESEPKKKGPKPKYKKSDFSFTNPKVTEAEKKSAEENKKKEYNRAVAGAEQLAVSEHKYYGNVISVMIEMGLLDYETTPRAKDLIKRFKEEGLEDEELDELFFEVAPPSEEAKQNLFEDYQEFLKEKLKKRKEETKRRKEERSKRLEEAKKKEGT